MRQRVIVLGGSGMLGSMVVDYLARFSNFDVIGTVIADTVAEKMAKITTCSHWERFVVDPVYGHILTDLEFQEHDWVINCIGVIKPVILARGRLGVSDAIAVNASFPRRLALRAEQKHFNVIQIATDCVYSGRKCGCNETEEHDAHDVYGKTKSLGEVESNSVKHLRCSVIGPEVRNFCSLLEWFRSRPEYSVVDGFTDHLWNGITTLHFAKICEGIIREEMEFSGVQHVVPHDQVTKCKLLECIATYFMRRDIEIQPTTSDEMRLSVLSTGNRKLNAHLWSNAGYAQPPMIHSMIKELADYENISDKK